MLFAEHGIDQEQQYGVNSVAKGKLLELILFAHLEFEKGADNAHPRILLLYRLMGLREGDSEEESEISIEGGTDMQSGLVGLRVSLG